MTAPYECEVRFSVDDIEAFHRRLAQLGARVREHYAFVDHYVRPRDHPWDPRSRTLRIREHHEPPSGSEVLLTAVEITRRDDLSFKRSQFPEGKVRLYAGTLANCWQVIHGLGCQSWVSVTKRDGALFEVPQFGELVTEHVDGIGWMCEIEEAGADPTAAAAAIRRKLGMLGVPPARVTGDPVAALVSGASRGGGTIYFCGSIRGGRALQPRYQRIVEFLQGRGWRVLTTHVAEPDVVQRERQEGVPAQAIYARDLRWLAACDLVVAEVTVPSLGVGVEITEAQHLGKPVVALCHDGVMLSAMLGGNPALRVLTYRDEDDLFAQLARAVQQWEPAGGVRS